MSNSESVVNGSLLYLLPASCNISMPSRGIPKTRSLSDLDSIIDKFSHKDLVVWRRSLMNNSEIMDTTSDFNPLATSSSPTLETAMGPFKTAEEANSVVSKLKHTYIYTATSSLENNVKKSEECQLQAKAIDYGSRIFSFNSPDVSAANNLQINASVNSIPHPQVFSAKSPPVFSVVDSQFKISDVFTNSNSSTSYSPMKYTSSELQKNIAPSVKSITTYVFFDLETTGLAHEIGKSNVQITEVSMIAIGRKELEQSTFDDLRDIRIIQKLCLCTRPRTMISSSAAFVTGLNNDNLVDQQPFDRNAAESINFFLSHLSKPVCLLAHNGNRYDFPLLKAEFSRLSMSLPSDIYISDTLRAFRDLGVPVFPPDKKISKSVKYTKRGQVSYALANLHLYFFNKHPTGSHSSEGDCIALAKVCHIMKDLMLPWIDENCSTFDTISPMW
ncbi:three-prime repair exonuclease 1 [Caerostris darwini]|uniref:Three-prime repair exonuclease 1 n=1 Tax=Caerostris darwini TaxID=1538125 RepID=A0AAV4VR80_9ARAC|nr:three-prime repair exonuclease 1 [Caerostris darwini]